MESFTITAVIPTVQYGNLQPSITVEANTFEEAKEIALKRIQELWDVYGERPLKGRTVVSAADIIEVTTFTGEKVLWNESAHEYTDLKGNHLVSGSEYAKSFEKAFDTALLSGKVATKYKVDASRVVDVWKGNSKISTTFGNSLHLAMEQWFKYKDTACDDKEYNLAKPAYLREAVKTFPHKDATVMPEVVLSNIQHLMAGTTDGLLITGEKTCVILDYKSDTDIKKNLPKHFRQLSYYAKILQLAGWSVSKLEVWNYTDKWEKYESDVLDVEVN